MIHALLAATVSHKICIEKTYKSHFLFSSHSYSYKSLETQKHHLKERINTNVTVGGVGWSNSNVRERNTGICLWTQP